MSDEEVAELLVREGALHEHGAADETREKDAAANLRSWIAAATAVCMAVRHGTVRDVDTALRALNEAVTELRSAALGETVRMEKIHG